MLYEYLTYLADVELNNAYSSTKGLSSICNNTSLVTTLYYSRLGCFGLDVALPK